MIIIIIIYSRQKVLTLVYKHRFNFHEYISSEGGPDMFNIAQYYTREL